MFCLLVADQLDFPAEIRDGDAPDILNADTDIPVVVAVELL